MLEGRQQHDGDEDERPAHARSGEQQARNPGAGDIQAPNPWTNSLWAAFQIKRKVNRS
jgi:hypothetical protein